MIAPVMVVAGTRQEAHLFALDNGLKDGEWRYADTLQSFRGYRGQVVKVGSWYPKWRRQQEQLAQAIRLAEELP